MIFIFTVIDSSLHGFNTNKHDDQLPVGLLGLLLGKISAQPHPTLYIQFLDRENNDKNNTLPLAKQICFKIVWGGVEILPLLSLLLKYFIIYYHFLIGSSHIWFSYIYSHVFITSWVYLKPT